MMPAPSSGPKKSPNRWLPPSVESARARYGGGTASMMKDWRAMRNTDHAAPTTHHRDTQGEDGRGQRGAEECGALDQAREEQGAALADPRDQGARGQRRQQGADAEEAHHECGGAEVRAEVAGAQCEHGQHRAVRDRVDDGRAVRRQGDATQPERSVLAGRRLHLPHPTPADGPGPADPSRGEQPAHGRLAEQHPAEHQHHADRLRRPERLAGEDDAEQDAGHRVQQADEGRPLRRASGAGR